MRNLLLIIAVVVFTFSVHAQQVPAEKQSGKIYLVGATAHLGNGEVIENSCIAFENGKIVLVADATVSKINTADGQLMDVSGKHVYPGLIAPNTTLGISEIGAVRATRDNREVGLINSNVRSAIAYNTDSRVTPTIRSNGILIAQIVPQGGRVSGSSSVMMLDGWNWEDAVVSEDDGIHVNWPGKFSRRGWWADNPGLAPNKNYSKQVAEVTSFLNEAEAYSKATPKKKNLKLEAMKGVFNKSQNLYLHVNGAKEIMEACEVLKDMNVNLVVVGGNEAWLVADYLKENNVSVILGNVQSLPRLKGDDIDQPFKGPMILDEAGVLFAMSHNGNWDQRNLPFKAGQAASYGLDKEKAIQAMTLNAATILGINDRVGTLEEGKDATLVVSTGDIMDMRTNNIELAFVQGGQIDLNNKQTALYEKFRKKYVDQGAIKE